MSKVKTSKGLIKTRNPNTVLLTTGQLKQKFGEPDSLGSYLVTINLPYPMQLAWDAKSYVTKMRCHKDVATRFQSVFTDILNHYGLEEIKRLKIDQFGGCFAFRQMRGGTDWSRHSWGIAIDLDPNRNLLRENGRTARFANPEYLPMIEIFYKHGFASLGGEKDYDWIHFEAIR